MRSDAMKRLMTDISSEEDWHQVMTQQQRLLAELEESQATLLESTHRLGHERERTQALEAKLEEQENTKRQLRELAKQGAEGSQAAQNKLDAAEKERSQQQQLLCQMARDLERALAQNEALAESSKALLEAEADTDNKIGTLTRALSDEQDKVNELESKLASAKEQIEAEQNAVEAEQQSQRRMAEMYQARMAALEHQMAEARDHHHQIVSSHGFSTQNSQLLHEQLNAQIAQQQQQLELLTQQLEQANKENAAAAAEASENRLSKTATEAELASTKQQLDELQPELQGKGEQLTAVQDQLSRAESQLAHLGAQNAKANAELQEIRKREISLERELLVSRETARAVTEAAADLEAKQLAAEQRAASAAASLREFELELSKRPPNVEDKQAKLDQALARVENMERQFLERQQVELTHRHAEAQVREQQHAVASAIQATNAAISAVQPFSPPLVPLRPEAQVVPVQTPLYEQVLAHSPVLNTSPFTISPKPNPDPTSLWGSSAVLQAELDKVRQSLAHHQVLGSKAP